MEDEGVGLNSKECVKSELIGVFDGMRRVGCFDRVCCKGVGCTYHLMLLLPLL